MNYNKVIIAGNLTRDPELKYLPSGAAVAQFGLAINRKWKDPQGEDHEEVCFVDISCFGKTAENTSQYMKKGSQMLVEGRLQLDQWEDKQSGQRRSKLKVVAERVQFVGSRNGSSQGTTQACGAEAPQRDSQDSGYQPDPTVDDMSF
jgi:single-strand DNA-binding protein